MSGQVLDRNNGSWAKYIGASERLALEIDLHWLFSWLSGIRNCCYLIVAASDIYFPISWFGTGSDSIIKQLNFSRHFSPLMHRLLNRKVNEISLWVEPHLFRVGDIYAVYGLACLYRANWNSNAKEYFWFRLLQAYIYRYFYCCIRQEWKGLNMGDVKFPVPYKQLTTDIKGIKTDLVLCSYDDHILVMATQIGAAGTMLHARKEEGFASNATFNVSVLFGKRDEPMLVACARQLIEHMSDAGSSRPLLISLGLKDHSVETLKGIIEAIKANKVW